MQDEFFGVPIIVPSLYKENNTVNHSRQGGQVSSQQKSNKIKRIQKRRKTEEFSLQTEPQLKIHY